MAEELAAIRRRVINVVGHELRTPVTMLHGLAEEACAATDLEEVTGAIGPALRRNAERLTRLLDDLLMAAGIQTAIPVGDPVPVDVVAAVRERWAVVGGGQADIAGRGVAQVPEQALTRALDQVLANAAQYSTAPPSVQVAEDEGDVVVVVRSPGPALHPEEVRLAHEAFFRGERAVTTRPGLGVGLPIARAVVEHVGGSLAFADGGEEGQGTVTTLRLPGGGGR